MFSTNPKVDAYIAQGCGRCPLVGTPDCKVRQWVTALETLRSICLTAGLIEELKWGVPCYTFEDKNILLLHGFKEYVAMSFFKGALMKDSAAILIQQTENVQAARQIRFTHHSEVLAMEPLLHAYIAEAMDLEKAGLAVSFKDTADFFVPAELQAQLDEDPIFSAAFAALTPGRQRGYLLYFAAAKQTKTRADRIRKWIPQILAGKGIHDK